VLKMAASDDYRHAAGNVRKADIDQRVALRVGEQKLFGIVGENADPVDALVDHAIEHAALPVDVDLAGLDERRRRDRKDSCERFGRVHAQRVRKPDAAGLVDRFRPALHHLKPHQPNG
jgi:hypothetical protein